MDVSLINKAGETALLVACHRWRWDVAQALLSSRTKEDLNFTVTDSSGFTALDYALKAGAEDIITKLGGGRNRKGARVSSFTKNNF